MSLSAPGRLAQGQETRLSAREVSLRLSLPSSRSHPMDTRKVTNILVHMGKFFAHELGLDLQSSDDDAPIMIPKCDPKYDPLCTGNATMEFKRSAFNTSAPPGSPRQQINSKTAFVDGKSIYGRSKGSAKVLRTYEKVGLDCAYRFEQIDNCVAIFWWCPSGLQSNNGHPYLVGQAGDQYRDHFVNKQIWNGCRDQQKSSW